MASQVRCGPRSMPMNNKFTGMSVNDIRQQLLRDLSIPDGAPATVSRDGGNTVTPVPESYRVCDGDLLEFVRPVGTKG